MDRFTARSRSLNFKEDVLGFPASEHFTSYHIPISSERVCLRPPYSAFGRVFLHSFPYAPYLPPLTPSQFSPLTPDAPHRHPIFLHLTIQSSASTARHNAGGACRGLGLAG